MRERLTSSYPIEIVESMLEIWGSRHLNLSTFLDTYVESKVFPLDRLERVMNYLLDVELETYFIFDVDFGFSYGVQAFQEKRIRACPW